MEREEKSPDMIVPQKKGRIDLFSRIVYFIIFSLTGLINYIPGHSMVTLPGEGQRGKGRYQLYS